MIAVFSSEMADRTSPKILDLDRSSQVLRRPNRSYEVPVFLFR